MDAASICPAHLRRLVVGALMATTSDIELHLPLWIDVCAVAVGSLSGALAATRHQLDVGGAIVLAILTGLGGGVIRDVLLQRGTPVALTSPWLLPTAVLGGLIGIALLPAVGRARGTGSVAVVVDSLVLGLYTIVGAAKALDAGLPAASCVLLGVVTGVGGGLLRDIVVNERSGLLQPGALQALAATAGCAVYVAAVAVLDAPSGIGAAAALLIVGIRLVSVRRGIHSPAASDVATGFERIVQRGKRTQRRDD